MDIVDNASRALIAPILDDIAARMRAAAFHAVGGIPSDEDLTGICRRVANNHGCTPEDVRRWWDSAQPETETEEPA